MSSRGATKPSHWTSNFPIVCPSYRAVLNFKHSTQPTCSGIFLSVMDFTPRLTWRDIDQFKFRAAWEGCKPRAARCMAFISARLSYQLHLQPLTTPSHTTHASTRGTSHAFLLRCLRGRGSIDVPPGICVQVLATQP